MAGFLTSSSVSLDNGSNVVNVTGSVDCSFVVSGTAVYINDMLLEGVSGTASDPSGNSTITLRNVYTGTSIVGGTLVAFNTIEGLRDAIQRARELSAQFQDGLVDITQTDTSLKTFLTVLDPTTTITFNDESTVVVTPYQVLVNKVTAQGAASGVTKTGGGSVQNFIDDTNLKISDLLYLTSSIGRYGTTEDIPLTQQYTLDGMGQEVDNPLTTPPVNYKTPVSVRGERITATGTPAGGVAGAVNYYVALELSRAGDSITDCWYFGNGKGTFSAYNPLAVNEWINPFIFGANYQKMIGNTILEPCGHAIENSATATRGLIAANNFVYKHNGLGVTNVIGYVSNGNLSDTTSDSHITENSCTYAALVGNVGHSAIAASGQDLAGGMNIVSSSSVFANNQFAGVWALKSPNTGMVLTNANIHGHVLSGNTKYPGAVVGQGELTLGDYNNPAAYQGKAWFAHGNLIDVSAGTNFSLAAWVHKLVSAPSVSYNYITGVDKPSDATQIVDEGAEYASYVGNIGRSASESGDFVYSTLYLKSKVAGRGASYSGNDGFRVDPQSTVKPEVMHDVDGHWVYSCVLPESASDVGLARLVYEGGFTAYTVKLTITSRGGSGSGAGVLEKYIALKGFTGGATTVLANVDVHAFGDVIGVQLNTASNNQTDIILQAHTGEYAVKLEVIAPTSDRNHILMFY